MGAFFGVYIEVLGAWVIAMFVALYILIAAMLVISLFVMVDTLRRRREAKRYGEPYEGEDFLASCLAFGTAVVLAAIFIYPVVIPQ